MAAAEVLVLHGSPGAGKSTQARAVSEVLRVAGQPHAVIDLDEISLAWPDRGRSFARRDLASLWPEYSSVPGVRVIRIRGFVELYAARRDLGRIRDFTVSTDGLSEEEAAREVLAKAGWT